jgi:peptidoglycan hydrolase CwlO-like protein
MTASLQKFDAQIERAKTEVANVRSKIENTQAVLSKLTQGDIKIGDPAFDIENANLQDVIKQGQVMEANIADLILSLEDVTNAFGTEFNQMQALTGFEKLIGFVSKKKAQSMRTDRVRNTSLSTNLQDLLAKSDTIVQLLTEQKALLTAQHAESEQSLRSVIESRKGSVAALDEIQAQIKALNPQLMDIENRIAASTDAFERTNLEAERSKLATEYNAATAKEQEVLAESQTYERYTKMFQQFVESLDNQIAAQNTLINKLTIDTTQRVGLYKSLEVSLKTAAQQEVAHKINTLGTAVDLQAEQTMAGIGAAAQAQIASLLEMHEGTMQASGDIARRKKLADDAFFRRYDSVKAKHETASYGAA